MGKIGLVRDLMGNVYSYIINRNKRSREVRALQFRHRDFVEIIYMDRCGILTQRRIHVISVKGGRILAYCYLRRQIRTFDVSNVLGALKIAHRETHRAIS